ncbi:hypothetical protein K7I13_05250 [Brucepastera parasyntrophica]|uniref:hypothetical protein n=1 Tax=Brucepastera parasyntrophica TaxID=2880008 RepID=UPI00210AEF7D|nr:hypothetical protein [Brucepastera parasyntrophica]ULQ60680.1 hypothetical protein K7I13_05250 [Brucepastera parasyntrophica]
MQEAISYLALFINQKIGVDFIRSNETIEVPSLKKGSGISDGRVDLQGWKTNTLSYMLKELQKEV